MIKNKNSKEEFGAEFGDINAIKIYDLAYRENKKKNKDKEKIKK
ncbi:hypothetical protein ACQKP0_19410 [Heyndrickxia sp. NPDC080065]